MGRHNDRRSAGRSKSVPFIKGEEPKKRHYRRFKVAYEASERFREFCVRNNFVLRIKNHGQHWAIQNGDKIAEWWPSSAKLIFDKDWEGGVHIHDIGILEREIIKKWKLEAKHEVQPE